MLPGNPLTSPIRGFVGCTLQYGRRWRKKGRRKKKRRKRSREGRGRDGEREGEGGNSLWIFRVGIVGRGRGCTVLEITLKYTMN